MRKVFAIPIALGGIVIGACSGDATAESDGRGECKPSCVPLKGEPGILSIENRSGARVEIGVADRDGVRIDRRVVTGSLALPIPVITAGFERRLSLEAGRSTSFDNQVMIIDGDTTGDRFGAIIRVADGPAVLAVGMGRMFVRASDDGTPALEAEDPKVITIAPTSRTVPECTAGALSAPFPPPPASLFDASRKNPTAQRVRSVVRGADGCRDIDIVDDDGDAVANVHACIPDEAYPFVDGDEIRVFATGESMTPVTTTMRFVEPSGAELTLTRVLFGARTSTDAEGLSLTLDPDDACAHVDPRCGHVDVPARMTARTDDGTTTHVIYGQPIVDDTRRRTFYVVTASARPVAATACTGDDDPGAMALGRAWVATTIPGVR